MKHKLKKVPVVLTCICTVGIGAFIASNMRRGDVATCQRQLEEYRARVASIEQQIDELKEAVQNLQIDVVEPDSAAVPTYDIPLSEDLQEYTYTLCEYYSIVDYYEVVLGIMSTESGFDADAISGTSDYGIMQINACNHAWLKEELDIVDIMDVKSNIECGIYIFSDLIHTYKDVHKALMAYNMGATGASALWSAGIYTSVYSDKVLDNAELIKSSK